MHKQRQEWTHNSSIETRLSHSKQIREITLLPINSINNPKAHYNISLINEIQKWSNTSFHNSPTQSFKNDHLPEEFDVISAVARLLLTSLRTEWQ